MAVAEKVVVPKPDVPIINSVKFDTNSYKEGRGGRVGRNNGKLICGCAACQRLLEMVAAKKGPDLDQIIQANLAQAARVKMSLQVDAPGFFLLPNLAKKTESNFTHVFFPEPGKFSLVSIYKSIRDNADDFKEGVTTGRLRRKLDDKQNAFFLETFGKVFPFGIKNRTQLERKCPAWKPIEKSIVAAIRKGVVPDAEKEKPREDGEIFKVFDRYIPILWDGRKAHVFLAENKIDSRGIIPGLEANKAPEKSGSYTVGRAQSLAEKLEHNFTVNLLPMGYDPVKKLLVYSHDIAGVIHDWLVENAKDFKGKVSDTALTIAKNVPNPKRFFDALNENLRKNGAPAFSAVMGVPGRYEATYSKYNFKNGGGKYEYAKEYGYSVNVSFKGKPEIGVGGRRAGSVTVRTNEDLTEFILIQSAWCQRVSSWSKNQLGVVDQHYNIWPFADWLSGPYAERENLVQEEVPLVFCGNKARTSKRDVLKDLRNRLANL